MNAITLPMEELYEHVLCDLEAALHRLESRVHPPQPVPFRNGLVARHVERTAEQAIIQKLARIISGLSAALLLLKHGLLQEQAVIQRVLGELHEDVLFLSFGIFKKELSGQLHQAFLADFYQETFEDSVTLIAQKRHIVPRRKIQAYLASADSKVGNPSKNQEVAWSLFQAFSGFVHAVSSQIMDMYVGNPPRFYVRGMLGTPRVKEYERSIWNYFERGMAVFVIAAGILGDVELHKRLFAQKQSFDEQSTRLRP